MAAVISNLLEKLTISATKSTLRHAVRVSVCGLRTNPSWSNKNQPVPAVQKIESLPETDRQKAFKDISNKVNSQVANKTEGRLFAVVQILGKQYKITTEDIVAIHSNWPPDIGDSIKLEKVLLVGGRDFTLIGAPILPSDLVRIEATIVERGLSHTITHFKMRRRKQYRRMNFEQNPQTIIRINSIQITGKLGECNLEEEEQKSS